MRATLLLPLAIALSAVGAGAQEQVNRTVNTPPTGEVEVENLAGRVRLTGWNRNEVQVTGTVGANVERVAVESSGGRVEVRVEIREGRNQCNRNACNADLEIRVPSRKNVSIETTSADITVAAVTGTVTAESTSGSVAVSGSPRMVTAESTSGEVRVDATTSTVRAGTTSGAIHVAGNVQRSVSAESVSGAVNVQASTPELAAETVSGTLMVASVGRRASVSTVSGNATVRSSGIQHLAFESVSGNLRFEGSPQDGAAFNIESHSGDVELRLPASVSADFQVSTFSGDISNGFGQPARRTDRYGPGEELRFSTGRGGVISVQTFSGDIRLIRR